MVTIDIARISRHLLMTRWQVARAFPRATLEAIERAIAGSEAAHAGELRFVVEAGLTGSVLYRGQPARQRAIDVFSHLRMWDTDARNGVLIYLLMADRAVEIVADRGVHQKVGPAGWEKICAHMQAAFRAGHYEAGALEGIAAVTQRLAEHFPGSGARRNELSDQVVLL